MTRMVYVSMWTVRCLPVNVRVPESKLSQSGSGLYAAPCTAS